MIYKKPTYFAHPGELRRWFEQNHTTVDELWVGFYKKATGIPSVDWPQSVDEALCFGWIDGIRKKIDEKSYMIRFTPRRANSHWSAVNIANVKRLKKEGLMTPAGIEAFNQRTAKRSKQFSYEQETVELAPPYLQKIKQDPAAWAFFNNLAPSYQKASRYWVMSAKQEKTRLRRLEQLIGSSAAGKKIPLLRRPGE